MRVLFCSPFKQERGYVQGGMATWGSHILKYYESLKETDVDLIPISFDRKTYIVNKQTSFLKRTLNGIMELGKPILSSIKMMKKQKVDAIHICTSAQLGLVKDLLLIMAAKHFHVRSIIHFHLGRIPEILNGEGKEKRLLLKVLEKVDVIMVMDTYSFKALRNKGYTNVLNMPNPISPYIVNLINKQSLLSSRETNRVLYAGHIVKTKGVYELVEACSAINGIELRLAGRYTEDVKSDLIKLWGNKPTGELMFLGEVTHDEVIKEMIEASVFSLPSYTEGFPNVIIEAMACECPIVATDVGAIAEMLNIGKEKECGVCVLSRDVEGLKTKISVMLKDKKYAEECGKNAKEKVLNSYSMEKIWSYLKFGWGEYSKDKAISFI